MKRHIIRHPSGQHLETAQVRSKPSGGIVDPNSPTGDRVWALAF